LYARAGKAFSYLTGEEMVRYSEEQILELIAKEYKGKKIMLLAPLVKGRKGHYKELFETTRKKGYLHVRIDGDIQELSYGLKVDRYKIHDIELVIDRIIVQDSNRQRLSKSLKQGMQQGDGIIMILDVEADSIRYFSKNLMCPTTGISYNEPAPHNFSFNSPHGACPTCKGLGFINEIDIEKIIPNPSLSIYNGAIVPLGKHKNSVIYWQIEAILEKYDCHIKMPVTEIPKEAMDEILNGTDERLKIKNQSLGDSNYFLNYDGIIKYIEMQQDRDASATEQKWANQFSQEIICPACKGTRLKKESLYFKIHDKNIAELAKMDIDELHEWISQVEQYLSEKQRTIDVEILKEIKQRLRFLINVGLDYLSLNRNSYSLSGGESQRIRLATQIGTQLVNVLYILDEPSIGLHQRDNQKLIKSLKQLRDSGNSIIVVEHDKEMMLSADFLIDLGPGAGRLGGNVVYAGSPEGILKSNSLTASYLNGKEKIEIPSKIRPGSGKLLTIKGACGNNLKNIDVSFPLGKMICVTGVSGSGKSTLINSTLQPILSQHFYSSLKDPLGYRSVEGIENIDKVVMVDQSPIGRSPRSNPVTYTGVFSEIRNLFVSLPEAKIRAYKPGRFSFNTVGGRCEVCSGNGYKTIEMNFLPDVHVTCESCGGKRYNKETLEIRFKGKSIADVLNMTINQAVDFFENQPRILNKIKTLKEVGLGYIKLGQPSTTLSGGESQRVKLAAELSKKDTGNTLYLLDEPTTGLHFEDIRVLLSVLNRLTDRGNTIIIIEHNMDVIKVCDHIIDIGPGGGREGGQIICSGTPQEVANNPNSKTGEYLKRELEGS
jgi:excinuclease ABC subunit A